MTADRRPQTAANLPLLPATRFAYLPSSAPIILLYSRFLEFRLERVVKQVREVAAQLPQARWLIIGQGLRSEEKKLEELLNKAGLMEYVRFTGWLPVEQIPAYLAAADVAIYPYDDTLINRTKCSVKLIDLMAAGLPIVADAVGQNVEYLRDGQAGLLTPPEDDAAMAAAVVALLQAPERRQTLGQAAHRGLEENFNWSHLVQMVEKAYQ